MTTETTTPTEALKLSSAESVVFERVGWGTYWFGSLASRRSDGNRHLRSLESMGLVRRVEGVALVDGDGFTIHPERYGTGWELTDAGIEVNEWREDIQACGRGPR